MRFAVALLGPAASEMAHARITESEDPRAEAEKVIAEYESYIKSLPYE